MTTQLVVRFVVLPGPGTGNGPIRVLGSFYGEHDYKLENAPVLFNRFFYTLVSSFFLPH